jgi:hypothetical protein
VPAQWGHGRFGLGSTLVRYSTFQTPYETLLSRIGAAGSQLEPSRRRTVAGLRERAVASHPNKAVAALS